MHHVIERITVDGVEYHGRGAVRFANGELPEAEVTFAPEPAAVLTASDTHDVRVTLRDGRTGAGRFALNSHDLNPGWRFIAREGCPEIEALFYD